MKNAYKHNEDGTTTIFVNYLDEAFEVTISPAQFEKVSSINGTWRMWWKSDSRTYYVAYTKNGKSIYLHRLITDFPKGMHVHHLDGNGLKNTEENLMVITPKEHALINKNKPKHPFIGDPSQGAELHLLSKFSQSGKRPFRLKINGIPIPINDDMEGHLRKAIAYWIMSENHKQMGKYTNIFTELGTVIKT